jgi:hypothetical protein
MTVATTGRASQAAGKRMGSAGDQVYVTSGAGVIDTWLNPPDRKNSDQNPVGSAKYQPKRQIRSGAFSWSRLLRLCPESVSRPKFSLGKCARD